MKRMVRMPRVVGLTVIMAVLLACVPVWGLDVPPLRGRVNDLAGLLSPNTVQLVEKELAALESSDSTQMVVLTVPSLEGETIEGFAIKTAQQWGIGRKGKDNGALLVVSKGDRSVRIEVGRGLEGSLTDALTGRIIDHVIVPEFKKGDFNAAWKKGWGHEAAARGEYQERETAGGATEERERGDLRLRPARLLVIMSVLRFLRLLCGRQSAARGCWRWAACMAGSGWWSSCRARVCWDFRAVRLRAGRAAAEGFSAEEAVFRAAALLRRRRIMQRRRLVRKW
jgi:uncharacterized protein